MRIENCRWNWKKIRKTTKKTRQYKVFPKIINCNTMKKLIYTETVVGIEHFQPLLLGCKKILDSDKPKIEQLTNIADLAKSAIHDSNISISPEFWTTISSGFIDLLDQIIFEMDAPSFQEYIIDDMLIKLSIYIDALTDISKYKKDFMYRPFSPEDAKIISFHSLSDLIPNMLTEFEQLPHLRKYIAKSLLSFNLPNLIPFYSDIIQGDYCIETKAYALSGIKKSEISEEILNNILETVPSALIHYALDFDAQELIKNEMPYTLETIYFTVVIIQLESDILYKQQNFIWFLNIAQCLKEFRRDNPEHIALFSIITEIFLSLSPYNLKKFLDNEEALKKFVILIDLLPREEFDKMISFLDTLGNKFTNSINRLIETKKLELDKARSNIFSYLMWAKGIEL